MTVNSIFCFKVMLYKSSYISVNILVKQLANNVELGSAPSFLPSKRQLFLPTLGKFIDNKTVGFRTNLRVKSHNWTVVVNWCHINNNDMTCVFLLRFSVNRRIFVVGFGLYGSIHGPTDYQVNIQVWTRTPSELLCVLPLSQVWAFAIAPKKMLLHQELV